MDDKKMAKALILVDVLKFSQEIEVENLTEAAKTLGVLFERFYGALVMTFPKEERIKFLDALINCIRMDIVTNLSRIEGEQTFAFDFEKGGQDG